MIKNYLLVAFRTIIRSKLYAAIHILGLSIGISASLVIFLIVRYEFSFDKFEKDSDRIYRVVIDMKVSGLQGYSAAVPAPLGAAIQDEVSGVQYTVPVMTFQGDARVNVEVMQNGKPVVFKHQDGVVFTNSDYFELLPYNWVAGSPQGSLKEPFSVVLTESRARLYFGQEPLDNIVGKQITYQDDLKFIVTGVTRDLDENTDFVGREFLSHSTIVKTRLHENFMMTVWNDWMAYSTVFVKLQEDNDIAGVEAQLATLLAKYIKDTGTDVKNSRTFHLQPLEDMHFDSRYAGFGQRLAHMPTLYGLLAIAGFLLLLGCINFTNLATAHASRRSKEIGIRKTVGSSRKQLIFQFLSEAFCITLLATVLSICIAPLLLDQFSDFIPAGITFEVWNEPVILAFLLGLMMMVSFFAGIYPALVLSGFRPVVVLKDQVFSGVAARTGGLRKFLIVFQFATAQVFVIAAFMVTKQIHFALNEDLGYRKDAIITFITPRDPDADHRQTLLNKLSAMPEVELVSAGFLPPAAEGAAFSNISYNDGKSEIIVPGVQIRWGDANYLNLYKVNIVAGRNIREGKDVQEVLINESYAKELGFKDPLAALGKELTMNRGSKWPIVGVMQNFHETSLRGQIGPLVFKSEAGSFFHIALMPQDPSGSVWPSALAKMETAYHDIYPESEFKYDFYDDSIAKFYIREQNTGRLLNWAMGLSIIISCMGLLGLAVYTSAARTKEIGIRKIMGASVSAIVTLLSREFVMLIAVAFCIAAPVAWWSIYEWLQNFAYRTSMDWWVFAASGVALLLVALLTLGAQIIQTARQNPVKSLRSE
jgi:putative ABC transport system permease protein